MDKPITDGLMEFELVDVDGNLIKKWTWEQEGGGWTQATAPRSINPHLLQYIKSLAVPPRPETRGLLEQIGAARELTEALDFLGTLAKQEQEGF